MIWVIARDLKPGLPVYWAGNDRDGEPQHVNFWSEAHRFSSATAARECAATHPRLRNSDVWRVVQITERCEMLR